MLGYCCMTACRMVDVHPDIRTALHDGRYEGSCVNMPEECPVCMVNAGVMRISTVLSAVTEDASWLL
jgi:hypothetical protein